MTENQKFQQQLIEKYTEEEALCKIKFGVFMIEPHHAIGCPHNNRHCNRYNGCDDCWEKYIKMTYKITKQRKLE